MNYPGGKNHCYQKLINLMPPHRVYVEAFMGSGAILRRKRPALINIGIEVNPLVLGEVSQELPGFTVIDDVAAAASQIAMGTMDPPGENGDRSGGSYLVHGDCLDFFKTYPFQGDEFIYADPPYVRETRRTLFPIYEFEYTTNDHIALLNALKRMPCNVMISGYWSDLYADLLADWPTYEFDSMTRGGSLARDVIWMNYPEPDALHDYGYLGEDYRQRERIKRKKERWVAGLHRLDPLERKAILSALSEEFSLGQHRQRWR